VNHNLEPGHPDSGMLEPASEQAGTLASRHPSAPSQTRDGTGLPSRPAAAPGRAGTPAASPATPGQPPPEDLTAIVFRALYADYDLRTLRGLHVVTPKGTPVFIGDSLGRIACQLSDPEDHPPAGA
jgi:hypothetical protein